MGLASYLTGSGQVLPLHFENPDCHEHGCVFHRPSNHFMKYWPTHWNEEGGLMERICTHGHAHPDPDYLNFIARAIDQQAALAAGLHVCDACCDGV